MSTLTKICFCGIFAIFFQCCFMIETQVLMTVSNFSVFFQESFPGRGFDFSMRGGSVFQLGRHITPLWETLRYFFTTTMSNEINTVTKIMGICPIVYYYGMYDIKERHDYKSVTINFCSIRRKARFPSEFPNICLAVAHFLQLLYVFLFVG